MSQALTTSLNRSLLNQREKEKKRRPQQRKKKNWTRMETQYQRSQRYRLSSERTSRKELLPIRTR